MRTLLVHLSSAWKRKSTANDEGAEERNESELDRLRFMERSEGTLFRSPAQRKTGWRRSLGGPSTGREEKRSVCQASYPLCPRDANAAFRSQRRRVGPTGTAARTAPCSHARLGADQEGTCCGFIRCGLTCGGLGEPDRAMWAEAALGPSAITFSAASPLLTCQGRISTIAAFANPTAEGTRLACLDRIV